MEPERTVSGALLIGFGIGLVVGILVVLVAIGLILLAGLTV